MTSTDHSRMSVLASLLGESGCRPDKPNRFMRIRPDKPAGRLPSMAAPRSDAVIRSYSSEWLVQRGRNEKGEFVRGLTRPDDTSPARITKFLADWRYIVAAPDGDCIGKRLIKIDVRTIAGRA